jgi:hypothetical protein
LVPRLPCGLRCRFPGDVTSMPVANTTYIMLHAIILQSGV